MNQRILAERIKRQHFASPVEPVAYEELFRLFQPVAPVYFSKPGSAPVLTGRAAFNDEAYNEKRRASRKIIKGRFQNHTVGYVCMSELELYIAAYMKEINYLSFEQELIYNLLLREGPLTLRELKEATGLLVKTIKPELVKLQQAFLVYEDQLDNEWDRPWYAFENELPDIDVRRYEKTIAVCELIRRALYLLVYADRKILRSALKLPFTEIDEALKILIAERTVEVFEKGYLLTSDKEHLKDESVPKFVTVLHRGDFLVRAYEHELRDRFKNLEVLQYLLVDGEFKGAVTGHWRIGPHDVENIVVDAPLERRPEIIDAVSRIYHPPYSKILKYNGLSWRNK